MDVVGGVCNIQANEQRKECWLKGIGSERKGLFNMVASQSGTIMHVYVKSIDFPYLILTI